MNEKISWDPHLVKKYSSSNHFKLLNQLRTEVIKYPIIRKHKSGLDVNNKLESKSVINYEKNNSLSIKL